MQTTIPIFAEEAALTEIEGKKRQDQSIKRPRVYEKIQNYFGNMASGVISPILRLKINRSLCNFHCPHCCEEPYMTRDLKKKTGAIDPRHQMTIDDYAELSRQADEYGIYRFVLTGGEALLDKNLVIKFHSYSYNHRLIIYAFFLFLQVTSKFHDETYHLQTFQPP